MQNSEVSQQEISLNSDSEITLESHEDGTTSLREAGSAADFSDVSAPSSPEKERRETKNSKKKAKAKSKGSPQVKPAPSSGRALTPGAGKAKVKPSPATAGSAKGSKAKPAPSAPSTPKGGSGGGKALTPSSLRRFQDNFNDLGAPVRPGSDAEATLQGMGIKTEEQRNNLVENPHAVSAAVRYVATATAINALYKDGCRDICSLYGSKRDLEITNRLISGVPKKDDKGQVSVLKTTLYQRLVDPADITRGTSGANVINSLNLATSSFDGWLMVNVYALEDREFIPENLYEYAKRGPIYWVGHDFSGGAFGSIHKEGVWLRVNSEGKEAIIHRPDMAGSAEYGPHAPLDWIQTKGFWTHPSDGKALAWCPLGGGLGDTRVVKFQRVDAAALRQKSVVPTRRFRWVDLPIPALGGIGEELRDSLGNSLFYGGLRTFPVLQRLFKKEKVLIDESIVSRVTRQLAGKVFSKFSFQTVNHLVEADVNADPTLRAIQKCWPEHLARFTGGCALYIFTNALKHQVSQIECVRELHCDEIVRYNRALATFDVASESPKSSKLRWLMILGGCALFILALRFKWLRHRAMSAAPTANVAPGDVVTSIRFVKGRLDSFLDRLAWRVADFPDRCKALLRRLDRWFWTPLVPLSEKQMKLRVALASEPETRNFEFPERDWATIFYDTASSTIAVALEEAVKRMLPGWLGLIGFSAFIGAEYGGKLAALKFAGVTEPAMLIGLVGSILMHFFTWKIADYKTAVFVHGLWNLFWTWVYPQGGFKSAIVKGSTLGIVDLLRRLRDAKVEGRSVDQEFRSSWERFVENHHLAPWLDRAPVDQSTVAVSPFAPSMAYVFAQNLAYYTKKPRDDSVEVVVESPVGEISDSASCLTHGVHFLLPHNVPVLRPSNSEFMRQAVIDARLAVAPPLDPVSQATCWMIDARCLAMFTYGYFKESSDPERPIKYRLRQFDFAVHVDEEVIERWLSHFTEPYKKKRAQRALEQFQQGGWEAVFKACRSVKGMVKADEVLLTLSDNVPFPCDGPDHLYSTLKPRLIGNAHAIVQAAVGPEILVATERLHSLWSWNLEEQRGWWLSHGRDIVDVKIDENPLRCRTRVFITFGSDATDELLSNWMQQVLEHPARSSSIFILVAGDDAVVCLGGRFWIYLDFSMFDASQSMAKVHTSGGVVWDGPLGAELRFLKMLGVSKNSRKALEMLYQAPIIFDSKGFKTVFHHPTRPLRVTGGPDTTIGNSLTNVVSLLSALSKAHWSCDEIGPEMGRGELSFILDNMLRFFLGCFEKQMAHLGFKITMKTSWDWRDADFLKGKWYEAWTASGSRPVWAPLPSRFLKAGKTLSHPISIYWHQVKDLPKPERYERASRLFLSDIAWSLSLFAPVPVLREFVRKYKAFGKIRDYDLTRPWKVKGSGFWDPSWELGPDTFSDLGRRYDCAAEDLLDLERLIGQSDVFHFLEHPLFSKMAVADY